MLAHSSPHTSGPTPSVARYILAVVILVGGVLIQYFVVIPSPSFWIGELLGALATYGPGLVAFVALVGTQPLRNFGRRLRTGTLEGLRWYGIFGVLTIVAVIVAGAAFETLDRVRFERLIQQNTGLDLAGAANPWAWIAISFPVGVVEETLFRGFVLGGALLIFGTRRWKVHAVWTSALFTGVHLYYGIVYQEISLIFYLQIFLLGLAFAFAYVESGGNLLVVALLHGLFDATSFAQFLPGVGSSGAAVLKYAFLGFAAVVALALYLRERAPTSEPASVGQAPQVADFGMLTGSPSLPFAPAPMVASPVPSPMPGPWTPSSVAPPPPEPPPHHPSPSFPSGSPAGAQAPPPPPPPPLPGASGHFLPPVCRRCGAIVVGDVQGIPMRCPRCNEPLPTPTILPTVPETPLHPPLAAAPSPMAPMVPLLGPPPGAERSRSTPFYEDLPPGAWPPVPAWAPTSSLSHATLFPPGPSSPPGP